MDNQETPTFHCWTTDHMFNSVTQTLFGENGYSVARPHHPSITCHELNELTNKDYCQLFTHKKKKKNLKTRLRWARALQVNKLSHLTSYTTYSELLKTHKNNIKKEENILCFT